MIAATRLQEASTEGTASVWDYISPSRLNLWLRCPLAFRLRYIDGIRVPTNLNLFLGKAVHAGLEWFYRYRQVGVNRHESDVADRMDAEWDELAAKEDMKFDAATDATAAKTKASELVVAYLRHLPADEPKPMAVETTLEVPLVDPFNGEDLGIPLLGIVDLVVGGQDGPVIADFKTASKSSRGMEIMHEVQLTAYAYLFREMSQQTEAGLEIRSLIKTKTPKIEFHHYLPRKDAHFRRFFQLVRAYLDDLDAGRFVYRPGFGCAMCDHRDGHCRHWDGCPQQKTGPACVSLC